MSGDRKGVSHVLQPLLRIEVSLSRRATKAAQRARHWQPDCPCQVLCLIEAALSLLGRMQRDGDGDVRELEEVGVALTKPPANRACDGPPATILERVHNLA